MNRIRVLHVLPRQELRHCSCYRGQNRVYLERHPNASSQKRRPGRDATCSGLQAERPCVSCEAEDLARAFAKRRPAEVDFIVASIKYHWYIFDFVWSWCGAKHMRELGAKFRQQGNTRGKGLGDKMATEPRREERWPRAP